MTPIAKRLLALAGNSILSALVTWANIHIVGFLAGSGVYDFDRVWGYAVVILVMASGPFLVFGSAELEAWRRRREAEAALRESEAPAP